MKKTSIQDIAQKLNVSVATVSRALNNKEGVSEETRSRVLEEVYNMKYLSNSAARNLQGQVNKNVGIFISSRYEDPILPDSLTKKMMGIARVAGEKGYTISLFFEDFKTDKNKIWELINQNDLCGIIALNTMDKQVYKMISHYEIPFVSVNWYYRSVDVGFDAKKSAWVLTDWRAAIEMFLEHMLERNYSDIGVINWQDDITKSPEYSEIIKELFEQYHITNGTIWNTDIFRTKKQLYEYLDAHPKRAYISMFYKYGFWILDYCRERGLRVPEDVAVTIYDYVAMFEYMNPRITGIIQPTKKLGEKSMELLIELIEGKPFSKTVKVEPLFVPGETT